MPLRLFAGLAAMLLYACAPSDGKALIQAPGSDPGESPHTDGGIPTLPDAGPPPVGEPNPVALENALPGTTSWAISQAAGAGQLEGYASDVSVNHGGSVTIHVRTDKPSQARWELYRMGWYGGAGGRLIASGGPFDAGSLPSPTPDPVTGLVECRWPASFRLETRAGWASGIHLIKLVRQDGLEAYVPIVIRADERKKTAVVQASITTWQAYNDWGGESLYGDALGLPGGHASEVSFDRPYRDGFGAGEYFYFEHFLVQWLESRGYDATYLTNVDAHRDPSLLMGQRLLISSGHDEYWSRGEKDAVDAALADGTNVAYLTADESFWQIRLEPSRSDKRPWRTEVCYKEAAPAHDPQAGTNLITMRWRDVEVGAPEQATHGVMSDGWEFADLPWIVRGSGSWVYAGTGLKDGDSIPLLVGYESDRIFAEFAQPAGVEVLARSPVVSFDSGEAGPSWHNSTVYTTPSGAFVFAAGVVQWSYGLSSPGVADARVQRMTDNLFQHAGLAPSLRGDSFGAGPPRIEASGAAASVSTLSGASYEEALVDGPAARARFRRPVGIAADAGGNIYIADSGNHAVRKIAADAERTVTTLAGADVLSAPYGVALGQDGLLYVADFGKNRISRIAPDVPHTVSVWAGSPNGNSGTADGNGTAALFNMPVAVAAVGNDLYVVDSMTSRVRRIDGAQNVTTVVGLKGRGHTDGEGVNARLNHPTGIAAGTDGLYVVDSGNRVIRRIALDGRYTVTTIAGSGQGGYADGPAAVAMLMPLLGAVVLDGTVLVADGGSARIRKIAGGNVTTWAGNGRSGADDGPALSASFNVPAGLAVLPGGTVAVADQGGSTIRLVRSR
jgi:hypothetical protein